MRPIYADKRGFALVTSLMLTLISLTIVLSILYFITQGTQLSGLHRKYRTALEASHGGTELFTKDILPYVMRNYSSTSLKDDLETNFGSVSLNVLNSGCLQKKLVNATQNWPSGCDNVSNPTKNPDLRFTMQSADGNNPFYVYSKIVDTMTGNTDISGLQLEGAGVAESQSVLTPQHFPYIYRVEVQGERANNSSAQANIEVLYAY